MAEEKKEQQAQNESGSSEMKSDAEEQILLPEVTFSSFIVSLSTAALVHLGEMEEPGTGAKGKNLPMAKHTIDTLAMLQDKTKGNLDDEEKALLDHILFDLRLKFVKASKRG